MTSAQKTKSHPDAVFGPDEDVLIQLVERLKVTDVRAFTPDNQTKISLAIAAAAKRLVEDHTKLVQDREYLTEVRIRLETHRAEIEAREASVQARETLLGLYPAPQADIQRKSFFHFWK